MKKYGGAKTKTQKTREICEQENKDFNTVTKRCLKKCVPGKERGENFRCKTTRKNRAICERENKDFNLYTERCVKKCAPGKERDATFKCKKIKLPTSAVEVPNISRKDATDLLNFVAQLEEVGRKYEKTGIHFKANHLLGTIMYTYLIEKYNVNCFIYGTQFKQSYQEFIIDLGKFGLLGSKKYVDEYQKYVYKMIKLIMNCIMKIQNTPNEIIIIPLTIYDNDGSHANMLIYRKTLNVIEHYEPHGSKMYSELQTNEYVNKIMNVIIHKMNTINETNNYKYYSTGNIKYMPPSNICPHTRGFQSIENELILPNKITKIENEGFCMIWSIFFAEMTLQNPSFTSAEIFQYIYDNINNNPTKTKNIIRGYLNMLYTNINYIIQDIAGVSIDNISQGNLAENIIKIIGKKDFNKFFNNYIQNKFQKYNEIDIDRYFKEPNSIIFNDLSPTLN